KIQNLISAKSCPNRQGFIFTASCMHGCKQLFSRNFMLKASESNSIDDSAKISFFAHFPDFLSRLSPFFVFSLSERVLSAARDDRHGIQSIKVADVAA
ncbi:MAG: hypothetical protein ACKO0V_22610, partial [bacterium]